MEAHSASFASNFLVHSMRRCLEHYPFIVHRYFCVLYLTDTMTSAVEISSCLTSSVGATFVTGYIRFLVALPYLAKAFPLSFRYNEHRDVGAFSFRHTFLKGMLFIMDNKSMLLISEDTKFVGVVHDFIVITVVPEDFLVAVNGPELDVDSTFCTPHMH